MLKTKCDLSHFTFSFLSRQERDFRGHTDDRKRGQTEHQ